jgi:predicted deacylase
MPFDWEGSAVSAKSTACFEVPVCTMASGHRLALPVHVVTGNRAGPVVLVSCTSHGEELWSAEFCRRVKSFLVRDGHDFAGTMLLAPVLNPPSFESGTRNTPIDLHNLNRVFPGSPAGKNWFTDMLARVIAERILPKADIIFDYHGGGPDTVIHYHYTVDPNVSAKNRTIHEVALASGAEVLWENNEQRGTLTNHGDSLGKLCFVPEIGGGGLILDVDYFEKGYRDFLNMLKVVEVARGKPELGRARIVCKTGSSIRPAHGGTFVPVCGLEVLGKSVPKGTVLGRVISPYTFEVLDECVAPYARTEMMQVRNRISKVHPGEYAYIIGDGDSGYAP